MDVDVSRAKKRLQKNPPAVLTINVTLHAAVN